MAKQVINIVTCDRCKHTTKSPVDPSKLAAVSTGLVAFEDLCTK